MSSRISGIRALAILACYFGVSLNLSRLGVPAWMTCAAAFALLFIAFRIWHHLITLVVIFSMYGLVVGAPRPEPWSVALPLVLNDTSQFALRVLLYLIVPMVFFTSVVDPYQLSRDVARLRIPWAGPVLQLVGSIRLALFNRLAEIDMHLAVRGIHAGSGPARLRTVRLWTVPLLAALITEAANRSAYCHAMGLQFPPRLPAARHSATPVDWLLALAAIALFTLWLFTS